MAKTVTTRRECDLAAPISAYLTAQGYTVRSEVNDCDLTAVKDETLVVVELKKQFSVDLLIQATDRQRIADTVYVGLPVEGPIARWGRYDKRWRGIEHILKRLELGLILVHFPQAADLPPTVEVALHPVAEPRPRRRPKVRHLVLREIAGREAGDYNVGGSTKTAILTAYREQAIHIVCLLDKHGPLAPVALRRLGACPRTPSILLRNVYGWFDRLERGVYGLKPGTRDEIALTYPGVAAYYAQKVDAALDPAATPNAEAGECS